MDIFGIISSFLLSLFIKMQLIGFCDILTEYFSILVFCFFVEHQKINAAMEKCHYCFNKVPKHLIIAIGVKVRSVHNYNY